MLHKLFGNKVLKYSRRFSNLIMSQRFKHASKDAVQELQFRYPRVFGYLQQQIKDGGANHLFSNYKLLELLQILNKTQPQLIIEFGCGSTTAAFADYAERNPACRVISVDEHAPYQQDVYARLERSGYPPSKQLQKCFCEKIVETKDGRDRTRYTPNYIDLLGGQAPDLIYVDGPTTGLPDNPQANLPCVDAIYLCEQNLPPQQILFDFRIASVREFLKTSFQYGYEKSLNYQVLTPEEEPWVVSPITYHSRLCKQSM